MLIFYRNNTIIERVAMMPEEMQISAVMHYAQGRAATGHLRSNQKPL